MDLSATGVLLAMKPVYLVQGALARLQGLALPDGAIVYALCYDRNENLAYARKTIHDPRCSWAEGRNRLAELAQAEHPDLDYLIFADDDVEFLSGSFAAFEDWIRECQPKLAIPLMPKAERFGGQDSAVAEQAASIVDEQLVALHRSLLGIEGICPLIARFDDISWTTACLIFEYLTLSKFGAECRQNNTIRVANNGHTAVTGGTLYKAGRARDAYAAFRQYLESSGVAYDPQVMFFLRQNKPFLVRKAQQVHSLWRRIGPRIDRRPA